eukprot:SAG25_NODE_277_length_10482_cov_6.715919_2_plen_117_part_00
MITPRLTKRRQELHVRPLMMAAAGEVARLQRGCLAQRAQLLSLQPRADALRVEPVPTPQQRQLLLRRRLLLLLLLLLLRRRRRRRRLAPRPRGVAIRSLRCCGRPPCRRVYAPRRA